MPGGGGGLDGVTRWCRSAVPVWSGSPAGCLFGVVALLAEALAVGDGGLAAVGDGGDVVAVPDRGVAPGGAAELVAQVDRSRSRPRKSRLWESIATSSPVLGVGVEAA